MPATETIVDIPAVTDVERSARLAAAGTAWTERLTANPENGRITARATGRAVGAVATEITAGRHRFIIDEPTALAGDDAGPSPVEYALAALIGCQTVVYRLLAAQQGLQIDALEFDASGSLDVRGLFGDTTVRPGFDGITLTVRITGPESAERYEALRAAVDARCPVGDTLAFGSPVRSVIEVVGR